MNPPAARRKIAILGGGAGALAAAFGLTEKPAWQDAYEITVYQLGWRLGGKGASGRNASEGDRIEEHGLHVWAGFYDNAFRFMRDVYGGLDRGPSCPIRAWSDAFKATSAVTVAESVDGKWIPWTTIAPQNGDEPGTATSAPTTWEYVRHMLGWMIHEFGHSSYHVASAPAPLPLDAPDHVLRSVPRAEAALGGTTPAPPATGASANLPELPHIPMLSSAMAIAHVFEAAPEEHKSDHLRAIAWLLRAFMRGPGALVRAALSREDEGRRLWTLLDLGVATTIGIIEEGVLEHGWNAIDDQEWSDWLGRHGATRSTLDSALVRATYDYVFGFAGGNTNQVSLGAGTCCHGLLRLVFGYRGSLFWKMQAGMGDIVFAPAYELLARRGVKFEFFRRVRSLGLSADGKSIGTLTIGRQATVKNAAPYAPLRDVGGLPCWPSAPDYDQLVEGATLRDNKTDLESAWTPWPDVAVDTLVAGQDFDIVVLGISLGALGELCHELVAASPRWASMVAEVRTVATLALQLWLTKDTVSLGWTLPSTMLTAFAQPFDTWGDMSYLIARESWSGERAPKSLAYLCGPFQDPPSIPPFGDSTYPARALAVVDGLAKQWLDSNVGPMWPNGTTPANPNGLDPALIVSRYVRVNVNPTERYVLSVPGSWRYRMAPDDSGYDDLYLAGDWVKTSINAGCVEAAVTGGLLAARAICGYPSNVVDEPAGGAPRIV